MVANMRKESCWNAIPHNISRATKSVKMESIKIRYTCVKELNTFSEVFTLKEIEKGHVAHWMRVNGTSWGKVHKDLWTGWNDKNGNEIYCNDLISENGSKPYQVVWQSHAGEWIMQSLEEGRGYRNMAYDYAQRDYEIVGNVHLPKIEK